VVAFLAQAWSALGAEAERLASPRHDRATVRLQHLVALVGVERYRITTRALAEAFGQSPGPRQAVDRSVGPPDGPGQRGLGEDRRTRSGNGQGSRPRGATVEAGREDELSTLALSPVHHPRLITRV